MKQVVQIKRKQDIEQKLINGLLLELDYELASLFDAIQLENEKEMAKSKTRLAEIHHELEALHALQ
ncbi:MAG: hypothetical protein ACE3JQ_07335 [Paenisporosarcina sp.]